MSLWADVLVDAIIPHFDADVNTNAMSILHCLNVSGLALAIMPGLDFLDYKAA
jgi:hypothetical protein